MGKSALTGLTVAAVLGLALVFGGCDNSPNTTSGTTGGSTTQPSGKPKMACIMFGDDEFFRLIMLGMQDGAKKNDVVLLVGNSKDDQGKESELVQNYIDQNVAAIMISPHDTKSSIPALQHAHDKNIIVVTNNTSLDADFPEGVVECSNEDLGAQTGNACKKYITDKLGGKATIAIAAFKLENAPQSDLRTGGFKKALASMPDVKIIEIQQDTHDASTANGIIREVLNQHPEINVVYGANEGGTTGAVLAVKQSGNAGKIAVFGTDVSDQLIGFLKSDDNILQAITAQKPFEMGQKSMEIALKALHHEPFERKVVLNGVCLTRTAPADIDKFANDLKTWKASGN